MASEGINRPISSKNEEHACSDDEETESGTWTKARPCLPFIGEPGLNVKI